MLQLEQPVYYFPHAFWGFGDQWAICNYLLKKSECHKKPSQIQSAYWNPIFNEIKKCLVSSGNFFPVNSRATKHVDYCSTFASTFCPTFPCWKPNNNNNICYQFDGQSWAELKNLNHQEVTTIFKTLRPKYSLVNVGGMRNIHQSIALMSEAKAFIGIPSGMAQVACSVGIPAYIICKPTFDKFYEDGPPASHRHLMPNFHSKCIYFNKTNIFLCNTIEQFIDEFTNETEYALPENPVEIARPHKLL